ncbi:MAG: tetratricopeptide repeat protein [Candidatus Riflebacteria bacterium]|nr:tetratricopeptide repeat protein [Candidatus Riflebacteria bacterium]
MKGRFFWVLAFLFCFCVDFSLFGESAKLHIDVGLNHFYKKRYLEAFQEFKTAVEIDPRNAEARYNLARIYRIQGFLKEAIEELQMALVIDPGYQAARRELGEIKRVIESDVSQQVKIKGQEEAVKMRMEEPTTDFAEKRGQSLLKAGNLDGAIAAFEEAVKRDVNSARLSKTLGYLYYRKGKFFDAVMWYEKAAQLAPSDSEICLDLGIIYFKTEDFEKALSYIERAVRISPDMVKAQYALGEVFEKLNRFEDAAFQFRKCLELNPNLNEASEKLKNLSNRLGFTYFSRGAMYYQQGDYYKAEPLLSLASRYGALTEDQKRQTEEMLGAAKYWISKEKSKEEERQIRQKVDSEANINKNITIDDVIKNPSAYSGQAVDWQGMVAFRDVSGDGERIFVNVNSSVNPDSNMDYIFGIKFPQPLPSDPRIRVYSIHIEVKGKIVGVEKIMNTISHVQSTNRQPLIEASEVIFSDTREEGSEPLVLRYF